MTVVALLPCSSSAHLRAIANAGLCRRSDSPLLILLLRYGALLVLPPLADAIILRRLERRFRS